MGSERREAACIDQVHGPINCRRTDGHGERTRGRLLLGLFGWSSEFRLILMVVRIYAGHSTLRMTGQDATL